ncbi:uncharacterized protein LOC122863211 isoform X2 [Siniperca chuatsi]|uniref:uncharacterized protein LOC122863211 isoform X2 n=1 Tax=Siniperca chuatsi TaxID=119488 RepID=UPI001CE1D6B2|nr:uncharacterized protein LOC122863211 isoform X2 [Siniperca chuatsi]
MCPGRCCYAYAASLVRDIGAAFRLLFTPAIKLLVLEMTKLEARRRKYHERPGWWKGMNVTDLRAYVGLLILVGVYRSRGKPVGRRERTGRVDAAMPLKVFHAYSLLLRFDDRETRAARCAGQTGGSQGAGGQVGGVSALLLQLGARDNSGATGTVQRAAAAAASKRKRCQICPRRRTVKRTPCAAGATGTHLTQQAAAAVSLSVWPARSRHTAEPNSLALQQRCEGLCKISATKLSANCYYTKSAS